MIMQCTDCKGNQYGNNGSNFQNSKYGNNNRVFTVMKDGKGHRCTVCGSEKLKSIVKEKNK